MRNVCTPNDEAEARAIEALLAEHDIDALVLSYHDTAFDGIYQAGQGWGRIRVRSEDAEQAKSLIEDWRRGKPVPSGKQRIPFQ